VSSVQGTFEDIFGRYFLHLGLLPPLRFCVFKLHSVVDVIRSSLRQSRPNKAGLKCLSVRSSVRACVRTYERAYVRPFTKSFFRFQWNLVCM